LANHGKTAKNTPSLLEFEASHCYNLLHSDCFFDLVYANVSRLQYEEPLSSRG